MIEVDEFVDVAGLLADAVGVLRLDGAVGHSEDGFSSGVVALDEVTGGFRRGEVAVLAGAADSVSFDFSLRVVANILNEFPGACVGVVQAELFNTRLLARVIGLMHGVELGGEVRPTLEQLAAIETYDKLPLILNDNLPTPINELWELVSRRCNQSGLDFLYIHDPGLILTTQGEKGRVDEVIKDLRSLARDYNIAVLVSDTSLDAEELVVPRVKLVYHFADVLLLVKSGLAQCGGMEFVVARNRMGDMGTVILD